MSRKKEATHFVVPAPTVGDHTQVRDDRDHNVYPEVIYINNEPLILGVIGDHLIATASLFPTTTEEDADSTNILVFPADRSKFTTIDDLSPEVLIDFSKYSILLLEQIPGSVVTYGISSDDRGITGTTRKALGTSARNFHAHNYVSIESSLQTPESNKIFRSIREPFSHFLEDVFYSYLHTQVQVSSPLRLVRNEEKNELIAPYYNHGGVVFEIAGESLLERTEKFSIAMRLIHKYCTEFHVRSLSTFFDNFEFVQESDWKQELQGMSAQKIVKKIQENFSFLTVEQRNFLYRLGLKIARSDTSSLSADLKIFRSPTYSVGIIKKNGKIYFAVNPHFYAQRAGGLQTLGVEVPERIRLPESPYNVIEKRTAKAKRAHELVMGEF